MEITFESKFKLKSNQIIGLIDKNRYFINYLEIVTLAHIIEVILI